MLHALLHHKLDESIPEPKRFEDAVTSTVFGTLLLAGATDVLSEWLSCAKGPSGESRHVEAGLGGCWFWPSLRLAEPDVVLRMGAQLIVIEAKVSSGRHDLPGRGGDDEAIGDQLVRQWRSVAGGVGAPAPPALINAAQGTRPCLILLVDQRRSVRANRELIESVSRLPPEADVRLLTWQALHQLLWIGGRGEPARWANDLAAYLRLIGLDAFTGFGADAQFRWGRCADVRSWTIARRVSWLGFREVPSRDDLPLACAVIQAWREAPLRGPSRLGPPADGGFASAIAAVLGVGPALVRERIERVGTCSSEIGGLAHGGSEA